MTVYIFNQNMTDINFCFVCCTLVYLSCALSRSFSTIWICFILSVAMWCTEEIRYDEFKRKMPTRVASLAFLRPNNSNLAFYFLTWPREIDLAIWLFFGLFQFQDYITYLHYYILETLSQNGIHVSWGWLFNQDH